MVSFRGVVGGVYQKSSLDSFFGTQWTTQKFLTCQCDPAERRWLWPILAQNRITGSLTRSRCVWRGTTTLRSKFKRFFSRLAGPKCCYIVSQRIGNKLTRLYIYIYLWVLPHSGCPPPPKSRFFTDTEMENIPIYIYIHLLSILKSPVVFQELLQFHFSKVWWLPRPHYHGHSRWWLSHRNSKQWKEVGHLPHNSGQRLKCIMLIRLTSEKNKKGLGFLFLVAPKGNSYLHM